MINIWWTENAVYIIHTSSNLPHSSLDTSYATMCTPHSSPCTPHFSPCTPHSSPCTPHSSPCTPHSSSCTPHSFPCTPHSPCTPLPPWVHSCVAYETKLIPNKPEIDAKAVFVLFYSSLMTIKVEVTERNTCELLILVWNGVHALVLHEM